jgi:hypothetical protein
MISPRNDTCRPMDLEMVNFAYIPCFSVVGEEEVVSP